MKRLLFILTSLFACVIMMQAQVTISTSDLDGTIWEVCNAFDTKEQKQSSIIPTDVVPIGERSSKVIATRPTASDDKEIFEYTQNTEIMRWGNGKSFTYSYYLTDTIPTQFDASKVGKRTKGKYYVQYNPIIKRFMVYSIQYFDKNSYVMTLKLESTNYTGTADSFILKKHEKNRQM